MAAILLIIAGHWPHLLHFQMYYVSSNIRAQPHFWGMRLGYVLALVVFCRLLATSRICRGGLVASGESRIPDGVCGTPISYLSTPLSG